LIAAARLARHDPGGGVRLCKPAFDLELPLTVVTDAYAGTDERLAIKVNLRSYSAGLESSFVT
jgi:hypothetical protein